MVVIEELFVLLIHPIPKFWAFVHSSLHKIYVIPRLIQDQLQVWPTGLFHVHPYKKSLGFYSKSIIDLTPFQV